LITDEPPYYRRPPHRLQAETGAELDALMPAVLDKAFKGEL